MFTQDWREHWKLKSEPFSSEDADKDLVLEEIEAGAVPSAFDRIYGDPRMPAPGIVFGEKGSGKSGMRLMMRRRLAAHNRAHGDAKIFLVEYIDYNHYLEHFRARFSGPQDGKRAAKEVLKSWTFSDHLDCILSLATTKLGDMVLDDAEKHGRLSHKQKVNLLLLTALYYASERRTAAEALRKLRLAVKQFSMRAAVPWLIAILLTVVGTAVGLLPHLVDDWFGEPRTWYGIGAAVLAGAWLWFLFRRVSTTRKAQRAVRSVRVLGRDAAPLIDVLRGLRRREWEEFALPHGTDEESRYEFLQRLMDLTEAFGYRGWYVLMDRVDEPSLLSGDSDLMCRFIEKILDIKLLQYPDLALKLFLPIEMESIYRTASAEQLKSMRLDKSNLVSELKWSGQELFEIANKRLEACVGPGGAAKRIDELLEEGFDADYLRATLHALGTPRYCFGFLDALIGEHVKELPSDLEPDDPRWRIPRTTFDVTRASWVDRTGVLRRTMN